MSDGVRVTLEVIVHGPQAQAILECLRERYPDLDSSLGNNQHQVSIDRAGVTYLDGTREVRDVLGKCDGEWSHYVAIVPGHPD